MKMLSSCGEIQPACSKAKAQVASCTGTRLSPHSSHVYTALPASTSFQPSVRLGGRELAVPRMHKILIYEKGADFFFPRGCLIIG